MGELPMKFMFIALLILATSNASARPTIEVEGVAHELVVFDSKTGKNYDSDIGFCKLGGYKHATHSSGSPSSEGPFVILNSKGKVKETFPLKDNEDRFWTVWYIACEG
jgi:hypothetical protein